MTEPLRVILIDDEPLAREGLRLRLAREPDVVILGEFADVASALAAVRADPPDVAFVDIRLRGGDGFDFVERAADVHIPAIVFVTAFEEHAVRSYAVGALDYLLKPVEQERLRETLRRVRAHLERLRKEELADRVRSLLAEGAPPTAPRERAVGRIPLRTSAGIQLLDPREIDWIDAAGDLVRLHVGRATHAVRATMGEMLAQLEAHGFLRIHRSTIVNVARIRELQPYFHGEYIVLLHDGTKLKLSRGYRSAVTRLLA